MNDLQIFNNEEFGSVRTIVIDEEPWFVAKDITDVLGFANGRKAVEDNVDDEDKQVIQKSPAVTFEIPNRGMTFLNESGLYTLVIKCKLDRAKRFRRWITSEVIPQIRKTGRYRVSDNSDLSPELQLAYGIVDQLAIHERQIRETREIAEKAADSLEAIKDAVQPVIDRWRKTTNEKVKRITKFADKTHQAMWDEMYRELELRAGCNLNKRLENLRSRMRDNGETKTSVNKLCKMDVVERDKKLREIFSKIVSEYEIHYCA